MPQRNATIAAFAALGGYLLTLTLFYPGIMTYDAKYVWLAIKSGAGDWQSPVMTWVWSFTDRVIPGPGGMFLKIVTPYWLGFGLIAAALARRSLWLGLLTIALALSPPALALLGVIWRDVYLAGVWLLATALVFCATQCEVRFLRIAQAIALLLVAFGVLLRPNALPVAPILAAYALWPRGFAFRRSILLYVPAALAFYALVPLVYYSALGAKHEHPLHSILVFDLGGISNFARQNVFPSTWTPQETALIENGCYKPTLWDIYWNHDPCKFVMAKLEGEKIFGTPRLTEAWRDAVIAHPLAYLQHRAAFMRTFLFGVNLTMWPHDIEDFTKPVFPDRPGFTQFRALHDALKETFLFRAGTWVAACLVLAALALPRRATPGGAFALCVAGSAAAYVLSYFFVGVAPDFRFAYWAVVAALASAPVLWDAWRSG